ncbi:Hsp20/alpha crystallin family protein [Caenimonas aquaedulcis]|uniref:Hsp20/alpha crystallin family protein n=1 Tax=Caenimonas aquaedulcis TaxID=2793270 RepID=A0A931MJA3_9BURK|nr:Hsp20/alpha crystallin family protein [Caenimonas aquaedulcis]MBG9390573.1 Hsp20/alpha crystallin family protein [Caenimonas aquaedulcis]
MNGLFRPAADLLSQLHWLQRQMDPGRFDDGIRATSNAAFPVINVGRTAEALEVMVLAPGVDPKALDLSIDKGLLIITGERSPGIPANKEGTVAYANERFSGNFRRVISLPEDIDPAKVDAHYADGVLRVTLAKRESSRPRRIQIS